MPKVSVIVPVYNVESYVEKCLRSILYQTLNDIEIIIVNDCTPDKSMDIVKELLNEKSHPGKSLKIIDQPQNMGVAKARETGFLASTGEYIIYCDSDDWMDQRMCESMYECAKKNNADLVTCDFYFWFDESHKNVYKMPIWGNDSIRDYNEFISQTWTSLSNNLIRRNVYQSLINDDKDALSLTSSLGLRFCEDFHFLIRLIYFAQKRVSLPEPLYFYNQGNANSATKNLNKIISDEKKVYKDIIIFFKNHGVIDYYAKSIYPRLLKTMQDVILAGDFSEFKRNCAEAAPYALNNHWVNLKMRFMMWAALHNLTIFSYSIIKLRNIKESLLAKNRR